MSGSYEDEPLARVDVAAFAGRALAERLHERLAAYGLACTRLGIEAITADGQELHRVWRHDGLLDAAAIAERVRWQLDGWLTGGRRNSPARPTAGLIRLKLIPDGILVHLGLQPGLWGDAGAERDRAHRALSRVQGLLGPDAVLTAVAAGGRSAGDRVRFVPWGDERVPARPGKAPDKGRPVAELEGAAEAPEAVELENPVGAENAVGAGNAVEAGRAVELERAPGKEKAPDGQPPWPGRLPSPAPALVLPRPEPAVVLDGNHEPVGVSARLELSGTPTTLVLDGRENEITGWAGPWPVDERWWAPAEASRRARFQLAVADGRAFLMALSGGHWAIEAVYD